MDCVDVAGLTTAHMSPLGDLFQWMVLESHRIKSPASDSTLTTSCPCSSHHAMSFSAAVGREERRGARD